MSGEIDEKGMVPLRGSALVLLSGGMDSTACLHWALSRHREVRAIGFDYGQPHRDAELTAAGKIAKRRMVPFQIELLPELGGGLRDGVQDHTDEPGLSAAFVPGRNGLFLWRALNVAARLFYGDITLVIGACAEDAAAHPDCREEFFESIERSMGLGLDRQVKIAAPYVLMTKAQLIADVMGRFPSGLDDLQESWSCYRGTACGTCTACILRARALQSHQLVDLAMPTVMHGGDSGRARRLDG